MFILFFTLLTSLFWTMQRHYLIHIMIQQSRQIFTKPLHHCLLVHTNILLLIKLVIHMCVRYHILVSPVFFQVSKYSICFNLSTEYLKAPSTPKNGTTIYVIGGITNPFLLSNINPKDLSVKKNQYQFFKYSTRNIIFFEGKNIMSSF